MTTRNPVIEALHAFRERVGRAHGFDAERIAATIRAHERQRTAPSVRHGSETTRTVSARRTRAAKPAAAADTRRVKKAAARG